MIVYTPAKAADSIPVIDIAPFFSDDIEQRKAVAWEVHKASRETGFFYIENHGIPLERVNEHLRLAREFFALPAEEKDKVHIRHSP